MAATIFDFVGEQLEARTDLEKLEARGTVRLALKESGLEAQSVTIEQMLVVLEKVLPGELDSRGVDEAAAICNAMIAELKTAAASLEESVDTSPEEVFRRLASR